MGAPGARTVAEAELELENKQLRKALAQMRIERDIVKAATYFAKGSPSPISAIELGGHGVLW